MPGLRIAIDGPSGSGKSTLARALARRLGLRYVDTGAMYRAIAWKAREQGLDEPDAVVAMLDDTELEVRADPDAFAVVVDGAEVTAALREPEVGRWASWVATLPAVRRWLVDRQRLLAREGAVMEGRDIGTVVLPDADHKLFITATEEARLGRRRRQLGARGQEAERDVVERDHRDRTRSTSPLRPADDAIVVDTTEQTVEQSLGALLEAVTAGASGGRSDGRGDGGDPGGADPAER